MSRVGERAVREEEYVPRFRPFTLPAPSGPVTPDVVRSLAAEVLRPGHFFTGPGVLLEWESCPAEGTFWEVFQGRLLDPAHTRQRRTFEAWNVYQRGPEGRSGEPVLSLKLDAAAGELHVVR